MATFRIHQDEDQENFNVIGKFQHKENLLVTKKSNGNLKEKRTTLADLNNGQLVARAHAQKTALAKKNIKPLKKVTDENAILPPILEGKKPFLEPAKKLTVPVDQFKAFTVFVDGPEESNENECPAKDNVSSDFEHFDVSLSSNNSQMRHPLQELKNDLLVTPMSVGELMSPMSIDKSIIIVDDIAAQKQATLSRSERERFFDAEEYQHDILAYLREAESKHIPKFGYMKKQPDITHPMRTILVDWLVEVCEEYRLQNETLCLAISYIDRFLSVMSVVRAKLQLVGTAAMFIATKYEEIYPPDVSEFVFITDHTYTKKQVLRMEQLILKVLTFDLFVPSTYTFINLYATMTNLSENVKFLATYICELSLLEADPYLQYLPSMISAGAIALAKYNLDEPMWSSKLEDITNYSIDELKEIMMHLSRTHQMAVNLPQQAIQDKYKSNKFKEVSTINPQEFTEAEFTLNVQKLKHDAEQEAANEHNNENVRKMISSLLFD